MKRNILSAALLLFFAVLGYVMYSWFDAPEWRVSTITVSIFIVVEILRHWQDIGRDIILLFEAESPYKCRWLGSGFLVLLAFVILLGGLLYWGCMLV